MRATIAHRLAALALALAFALVPAGARHVLAGVTGTGVNDSYTVNEDRLLSEPAIGVLSNDLPSGPEAPPFKCVELDEVDTSGLDGELDIQMDGSFDFRPDENFNGSTSFTYKMGTSYAGVGACPEGGPSNDTTVTITVFEINDPPFVSTDQCAVDIEVEEDSGPFNSAPHCVQMQDFGPSDENNQSFDAWLVSNNNPDLFTVEPTINQVDGTYGRLTFTPAPNANGEARVTVRGRDSGGTADGGDDTSDPTRFFIEVNAANDAPTAGADTFQALPGRTLNILAPGVLKNDDDADGDDLTAEIVSNPSHGAVDLSANGAFSYTPTAGFIGVDAFSYRASDGDTSSPTRAVTINVSAVPTGNPSAPPATVTPTGAVPTTEATLEPSASPEGSASAEPSADASVSSSAIASLEPGASADPSPVDGEGGLSIPVLVVGLLLLSLIAFGGAVYVPKWLEARRARELPPES